MHEVVHMVLVGTKLLVSSFIKLTLVAFDVENAKNYLLFFQRKVKRKFDYTI